MDPELKEQEESLAHEDDNTDLPPSDIVAYNELRSCADIFRMYERNQLIIQPDFQRDVVWLNPAKTRFIDSLIKQLPIPSMCISLDHKTQQRLVIDGLQRISTILDFLNEKKEFRLSNLDDIDSAISGRTNHQIREKQNDLYDRVENLTIPVTVLRCDYTKKSHMNYLFTIFHRLNTGGNKLNNQEIRNCIFHGNFNDLLKELVDVLEFRYIFNIKKDKTYRFKYEELILRILALSESYQSYKGKLAKFLNDYMEEKRDLDQFIIDEKKETFIKAVELINEKINLPATFATMSKAVQEALFVGVINNYETIKDSSNADLNAKVNLLFIDDLFSTENLKEGLSQKEKVIDRINRAIEIFR